MTSAKDATSPNRNKRFKKIDTENEHDNLLQATTTTTTAQSSIDEFMTPTKQIRDVLKRKSSNTTKDSPPTDKLDDQASDNLKV